MGKQFTSEEQAAVDEKLAKVFAKRDEKPKDETLKKNVKKAAKKKNAKKGA